MTDMPDTIGDGKYVVDRHLGSGGMGEVLLAFTQAGEPVAIKLIRPDRLNEQTRARFEQEALKARTVVGTSRVARFLDADPFTARPWLAMEYVDGPTLGQFVDTAGVLPPVLAASMGALLAEGLSAVHAAGLLHRDLKPSNVILGDDGPVIIDFGLAAFADAASSLSHSGMVIGTPVAMAPEQAAGQTRVTPAADVYGLGVVLLYAAAGHYPYAAATPDILVARVASDQIPPDLSGLPGALEPLVAAMLAHEPGDRPTAHQVGRLCAEVMAGENVSTAGARRALLAHVAQLTPADERSDVYSISSSLEARIDAEAADLVAQQARGVEVLDSPLDGPPGMFEHLLKKWAESAEPAEPALVEPVAQRVATDASPTPRRPSAAHRIAKDLREAYAHSAAL
jgi:eukaryotic-like serine/threonine-protein kinase